MEGEEERKEERTWMRLGEDGDWVGLERGFRVSRIRSVSVHARVRISARFPHEA